MDWRHDAECAHEDPELFFPISDTGPAREQLEAARAVCRRCKVVDTCLEWALETGQRSGVLGGLTAQERRALRRVGAGGGVGRARRPVR
jgi:WhiB family redox-sensing transcriptional regulator